MRHRWMPPFDAVDTAHGTPERLPLIGAVIAHHHRALEVLGYNERDDGWIAHVKRILGPKLPAENDRAECGLRIPRWATVQVYKGRIPVCSCCGEPWPCTRETNEREAREDIEYLSRQIAKAADGICYACGEVITTRQEHLLAPEPNVELDGFTAPAFHTRWKCRSGLEAYDQVRRRKLGERWTPLVTEHPALYSSEITEEGSR